jgi:hypothetical protein
MFVWNEVINVWIYKPILKLGYKNSKIQLIISKLLKSNGENTGIWIRWRVFWGTPYYSESVLFCENSLRSFYNLMNNYYFCVWRDIKWQSLWKTFMDMGALLVRAIEASMYNMDSINWRITLSSSLQTTISRNHSSKRGKYCGSTTTSLWWECKIKTRPFYDRS